jgi:hypothetical protein
MKNVGKSLRLKRTTRSFVPQIAEELSQTKDFLRITTRTRLKRTAKGFASLKSVTQYCLLTTKKIFVKDAKERGI